MYICRIVLFEVEVLSFVNYKAADEYNSLTDDQKDKSNVQELIDIANAEREVRLNSDNNAVMWYVTWHRLGMISLNKRFMAKLHTLITKYEFILHYIYTY